LIGGIIILHLLNNFPTAPSTTPSQQPETRMKVKIKPQKLLKDLKASRFTKLSSAVFLVLTQILAHAATPPDPAVEMLFSEGTGAGGGVTTTNQGSLSGIATFADPTGTNVFPAFSINVPAGLYVPSGNQYSVDFGAFIPGAEGRAIDLVTTASPPGDGSVGSLSEITICGWLNARAFSTRGQIAYALSNSETGTPGFSLAHNSVGKLGLGINENSANAPTSIFGLTADANTGGNNWVFFAAVYDPSLGSGQLKYYFGRPDKLAYLDSGYDYTNVVEFAGALTVGNYGANDLSGLRDTASNAGNPLFRGLIDEFKVYTNAFTLDEVQQAQLNSAVPPVVASIIRQPANKVTPEGQNAIFDVDATGSGLVTYQWKTNGVDVPNATNATFTLSSVVLAESGKQVRVGVSNSVGGTLSSIATLSVTPANPHLMYLSFVEGTSRTTNSTISAASQNIHTANVGVLNGGSKFRQQNSSANGIGAGTYPVFGVNVPSGPYAPNPAYNLFSLNMGDTRYTNFPSGLVGSQGNRWLDFTNSVASPANTLGSMNALTICGWLNAGNLTFRGNNGGMGSQIVYALAEPTSTNRTGFALSHKSSWAIQLNINEWPGGSQNHSFGYVPVDTNFPAANWVFFAVTYDGTLTSQNLNYYFGNADTEVALDSGSPQDCNRGTITNTGPVTVGNMNGVSTLAGRAINGDNAAFFRGFIDELHVFNRVLSLAEIKQMQKAPALPSYLLQTQQGNNVALSWEQGEQPIMPPLQLQSNTNLATGVWTDVANPTNVTGSVRSLSLPKSGDAKFFRLQSR
jgi:hypothetical protein